MKILEIGGNRGATAELILDSLQDAYASYLFSDPSPDAVRAAESRLAVQHRRIRFITSHQARDSHYTS
jgi:hypothetical protein